MKRLKYYFRLYQAFLRIGMLCLVQYPMDSTIRLISIVAREAAGFLGVFAIANVVGNLGEVGYFFDTSGFCFVSNADISNGICVVSQFFSAVFFDDLVTRKIRGRVFD